MQWCRIKNIGFVLVLFLGLSGVTHAGPFTDEMSKCLVSKTTEADKTLFVRWVYTAMSLHPDVESMANISEAMKENLSRDTVKLMINLITDRCKIETQQAIKFEGEKSFGHAFEVLGGSAMQGLMSNANVQQFFSDLNKYYDPQELKTKMGMK
jgi:hypothetical protein